MLTNIAFGPRQRAGVEPARRRAASPRSRDERLRAVGFSRADLYLALMRGIR